MTKKPPTNDPNLPSYWCDEYRALLPKLIVMGDVYNGDLNYLDEPEKYLPKNTNEGEAYAGRLVRTVFENHTAPIINSYSGTLSLVDYGSGKKLLSEFEQDIDLQGNSLGVFFDAVDIAAMRDGLAYVLVDYYQSQPVESRADELTVKPRPFLRHIKASQLINWEMSRGHFTRCTIAEQYETPGKYGSTTEGVWRVIEGSDWRVVRLVQSDERKDEWVEQVVIDRNGKPLIGQYLGASGQPVQAPPVVIYKITGSGNQQPYFYDLAKLNIRLYQSQSDYWELLHKCNWPVPCFAVARAADIKQPDGSISIGPNDALVLGENGNAFYLQPSGESAAASQKSIAQIQSAINGYGLTSSLLDGGGKAKTATEIRVMFASVQKQIERFSKQKESAVSSVLELIALYAGKSIDIYDVKVVADVSALLTDETSIVSLYGAGLLSLEAAVARLHQLGYHPDAAAELVLLQAAAEQDQKQITEAMEPLEDYEKNA